MNKTITLLIVGVIFLALLLILLNSFVADEQAGLAPPVAAEKARPQQEAPPAHARERMQVPAAQTEQTAVPRLTPVPAADSGASLPSAEGVAVKTVPAQIDPGRTDSPEPHRNPVAVPASGAPSVPGLSAPAEAAPKRPTGSGRITNLVVFSTQEGATLRLAADRPLLYKSMLLSNPDRLVLDLEGQWISPASAVPQNKIVKSVRIGRQADSTRLVIDLKHAPAAYRLIKTSPQGLDIRVR